jgi:enoyl-CoA hydratase/carnithine racemase
VQLLRDGNVATVRFTCEGGPPLFSSHVLGELTSIVDRLAQDASIRFVVFRSSGSIFNAGNDLNEIRYMSEDQGYSLAKHGQHLCDSIENLPQITFTAINGHAIGGGCELALACSFRIMVAGAQIGSPVPRLRCPR